MGDNWASRWRFTVRCENADRVFLVKDRADAASRWLEMRRDRAGQWTLTDSLEPGEYRFRYFAVEGNTYFNCGDIDLQATPLVETDPAPTSTPTFTPV